MSNKLTIKLNCEILAEYQNYIVLAFYVDGKFNKVVTVNLDNNQEV